MFSIVGNVIFTFIQNKRAPFPNAMLSQQSFWQVPTWKRAMIFVFVCRHVLDMYSTNKWKNYGYEEFTFSYRLFNKYMKRDYDIMSSCEGLDKLPATSKYDSAKKKSPFTPVEEEQTRKKVFKVDINSDSE